MPAQLRELWQGFDASEAAAAFENVPDDVVQLYCSLFEQELASWPAEVREPLIDYHLSPRGLTVGFQEASNVEQLYVEVSTTGLLPDIPLLILSSNQVDPFKAVVSQGIPEQLLQAEIEGKMRLYTDFATSTPRGEVRPVEAGHVTIHLRGKLPVIDAITELVVGDRAVGRHEEGHAT